MKYYGAIGFAINEEKAPGVFSGTTERNYYGDVIRLSSKWVSANTLNDNINITNQLSIIADPFATQNFSQMIYATYMGARWKVESVEVQYPRLILSLGGVYNGE